MDIPASIMDMFVKIMNIINFFYIHFYVLKYKHSHINYRYVCKIVDINPCASTISQVSIIVYRPNSMAIQWLTPTTKDVDSYGWKFGITRTQCRNCMLTYYSWYTPNIVTNQSVLFL